MKKNITITLKEQGTEDKQSLEPEKAHSTGELVIVAKFGDNVLHRLASSLSNMITQVGRQADENSNLGDVFRIQFLAFGNYLVLNTSHIFVPRLFHERAFLCIRYLFFIGSSFRGMHHFKGDLY